MLIVRVELWSAITGKVTEIARMQIANDGAASATNPRLGDYVARTFTGRDTAALDRGRVTRTGHVRRWPRLDRHVWGLVHAALDACGYGRADPQEPVDG